MNPSWRTTLCGITGALCVGLSQIPELGAVFVKIFALLGATMPSVGLLFARDNNVTSEQALKKSGGPLSPPSGVPVVFFGLATGALLFVSGCVNRPPEARAWLVLKDVQVAVAAAETAYGDAVWAGRVSPADQDRADDAIRRFHAAYKIAITSAKLGTKQTDDLTALANDLIKLLYSWTPSRHN